MVSTKTKKSSKETDTTKSLTNQTEQDSQKVSSKKTTRTKKSTKKTTATVDMELSCPNHYIVIDYPTEGEIVSGLHYAIRIGASEGGTVEVAFNNGDWQTCRQAAGYWWYDWGYFTPGDHKIVARLIDSNGKVLRKSTPRKCKVV